MRAFLSRVLDFALRRRRDDRLSEEVQAHLDLLADDYVARGLSPADARLAARKAFGGVDQMQERYRDQRGLPFVDVFVQDVRFAFRLMRKSPSFSLTAIGSLALSMGALTLAFSAVNAVVLKPLPIRDPGSVYFLQSGSGGWSYPDYRDLRDRVTGVEALAGYRISMMNVGLAAEPAILWGYLATGNYFEGLGLTPAAGRFFTPDEDTRPGASPYAVIAYDTWQARFGGRMDVIGRDLAINGRPYTVLGVAPKGFHGTEVFYRPEIWVPMTMQAEIELGSTWLTRRETQNVMVVARLSSGLSKQQGEAVFAAAVAQLNREIPDRNGRLSATLTRPGFFGDQLGPAVRAFVWGLFALGILLMLAGCSNMAGLLLARGSDRAREIAVRAALGAGKARIARQLVTESLMLAACGGLGGAAIAWAGTRLASTQRLPTELPVQIDFTADAAIFAFAFTAAVLIGLLVGIAPARVAARLDLNQSLKASAGLSFGRHRMQTRELLVALQVALCVVLLQASFLAVRGLQRATTASLGWNPEGIVMAATELGLARYTGDQVDAYYRRVLAEVRRLPGVESATAANSVPLFIDQSSSSAFAVPATDPETASGVARYRVAPNFFATLQIPLRHGRDFSDFDTRATPVVAVINKTLAERLFGRVDVVGRQLREGRGGTPMEIIGVVEDGKYTSLGEGRRAALFTSLLQQYATSSMLIVRNAAGGGIRTEDLKRLMHDIDPNLPIRSAATGDELTALPLFPYRLMVAALGLLGVICSGLLLSGLHALLAYAVARRQREIGIRIALGAGRGSVARAVLARVFLVLAVGIGAGALLAAGTGPLVSSMVLGVSPREPLLLVAIATGLALIAIASCLGPVRRSLRVDPLAALRED
jgi:predicted permease